MKNSTKEILYPWYKNYDKNVPHHIEYPNINVHQLFDTAAKADSSHTCLIFEGESLTYGEVQKLIGIYSSKLMAYGIKPGDRVGLLLPNCPKFVIAFFAILKVGAVVVAINPLSTPYEIHYQVDDAGVKLVIGDMLHRENIQSGIQSTAAQILFYEDCSQSKADINEIISIDLKENLSEKVDFVPAVGGSNDCPFVPPDAPAIFQYSGGTTGLPKAAIGTHRGLVANIYQFSTWLTSLESGREIWLSAIPFYHVYGMVIGLCVAIQKRATLVVLPDARDIQAVTKAALKYRATFLPGVPALFSAMITYLETNNKVDGKFCIKTCISGSASLHEKTKRRFEELTGSHILEGYGLSEAPTATHCNPLQGENRIGSIGLPLPDVICKLVDIETGLVEVAPGEPGELILQSPQVMLGYHHPEEDDSQIIKNEWLYTGDVARMDQDGYFFLIDRKKDLIKVGGFQVWPKEVETILMQHPDVVEAAVIGRTRREDNLEIVQAWVVLKPGMTASIEDLKAWCSKSLSRYKVPREIHFIGSLPKSSVGKVLRRKLREI